jgi:hypothetical protein
VFVGSTLNSTDVLNFGEMIFLPPVEQGNVYAVSELNPTAIGIIDGRFHDVPAVWHKEILWALHKGVRVYGSAGLGALRAAELHSFGMRGNGWVFESFLDGTFEDNDEVTVARGDQDAGFVPASDAMVNIRRTLDSGYEANIISGVTKDALISIAKSIYYPLRTYGSIMKTGGEQGLPPEELLKLESWLQENKVDQKKIDALDMLEIMQKEEKSATRGESALDFLFERTSFFDPGNTDAQHWTAVRPAAAR